MLGAQHSEVVAHISLHAQEMQKSQLSQVNKILACSFNGQHLHNIALVSGWDKKRRSSQQYSS